MFGKKSLSKFLIIFIHKYRIARPSMCQYRQETKKKLVTRQQRKEILHFVVDDNSKCRCIQRTYSSTITTSDAAAHFNVCNVNNKCIFRLKPHFIAVSAFHGDRIFAAFILLNLSTGIRQAEVAVFIENSRFLFGANIVFIGTLTLSRMAGRFLVEAPRLT